MTINRVVNLRNAYRLTQELLYQPSQSEALALYALDELLAIAERDTSVRNHIVSRSRLHRNGFMKTILVDKDEWDDPSLLGCRLVLHVWDKETKRYSDEQVHDHRWPFWSLLLGGELEWTHYDISHDRHSGEVFSEYEYRSAGTNSFYSMSYIGRARLVPRFSAVVNAGTYMSMNEFELHKVAWPGDSTAATIFLQGSASRDASRVYIPGDCVPGADSVDRPGSGGLTVRVERLPYESIGRLLRRIVR